MCVCVCAFVCLCWCVCVCMCVCVRTRPQCTLVVIVLSVSFPSPFCPLRTSEAGPGPSSSVGPGYVSQNPVLRASLMNWLHNEGQFPFYPANPLDCSFTTMHCSQQTPFPRYRVQPGTELWHGVFLCVSVCVVRVCVYEYEFDCMFGLID